MRSRHDDLMLFFILKLFVYFRDRSSGQVSLGKRMNNRIRHYNLERIVSEGDRNCIWELRMNKNSFANLCELFQVQGGLQEDGQASPVEKDCMDPKWRRFKVIMDKCIWRDEGTDAFVGFMEEFIVNG
ncbi:hypothetical protein S83_032808 [Arachis hypogaea]